jgi:hypothetical protein
MWGAENIGDAVFPIFPRADAPAVHNPILVNRAFLQKRCRR